MQKFASRNASPPAPPKEHWPTDEELAAYIDGTLGKAESKRITEHLASCEDCYAVYMGAVRFQLESEPATRAMSVAPNVVQFPSREGVWNVGRLAAAAVAALVAVGSGGGYYYFLRPLPALMTASVTEPIQSKPGLTGSFWLGPTYRGPGDEGEGAPLDPASFQVGVQLVNLQVALETNQGEQAQDIVARMLQILNDQMFVEDLKAGYTGITQAIANGTPPEKLAGQASELARQAREAFDAPHLDFGQWAEAGRLAATAREFSYFRRGDTRAFLRRLVWRQKLGFGGMELDPAARQSLTEISRVLEKSSLGPPDYGKLNQELERILRIYYPES